MSVTAIKIASGLAAVFLGGGGVGYYLAGGSVPVSAAGSEAGTSWSSDVLGRLTRDLDLTPEQQSAFAPALEEADKKIGAQRERALFQIHLEVLAVHDRLLEIPGELTFTQENRLERSRELLNQTIAERFSSLVPAAHSSP